MIGLIRWIMAEIVSIVPRTGADADSRLAAIVDSSFDAIISKDLNSVVTSWNHAAERLFGYTAEEAVGQSILMLIPDRLRGEEVDIIARVKKGERVASYETVRRRKDGTLISVSLTVSPIKNRDGEIVGASKIARDITQAKESERRIRMLMREVNHRVKNQFAVILSIIRETNKHSISPEDFERRVRDRIMALSRSHDLLVTSEWSGASLFDVIQEHLKPFGHEDQISLSGPLLTLQPNAVQHIGMAFHELGTNSSKYGALSSEVGRIAISWQVATNLAGRREFLLNWEETAIPRKVDRREDSSRSGFGTVVLKRVAPQAVDGAAILERSPGHVRWSLTAPYEAVIVSPVSEMGDDPV
ncbi:PAS domain S-box protein [Mesorhizobium sp. CN2-181]|uniref:PAS domain S-box protein n=1 Tax=Mesorhizobium yinganensis TaxID=3157707 RepID=UPI0032B7398F